MTNFNLKQYLSENKLLQEIKINKPGSLYLNLDKLDQIFKDDENWNNDPDNEDTLIAFGGIDNISDTGSDEISFEQFKYVTEERSKIINFDITENEIAALYLKIFDYDLKRGYNEVIDVFNKYFPENPNRKIILKWLNIEENLQEIKINRPGVPFYFEKEDDWSYSYNDNQGAYYLFPHDEGDEYMIMSSHLDDNLGYDDIDFAPQVNVNTLENIDEFLDYIENIDPNYGTHDLRSMIDNFRKYKIPIYEFDLQGDGGYIFINLAIRYQDIIPYIKK